MREATEHLSTVRSEIFVLSAKYGLLNADDKILPYDQILTLELAKRLRQEVGLKIKNQLSDNPSDDEILLIAEPLYLVLVADIFSFSIRPRIYWEPDITSEGSFVSSILESWGWK